MTHHLELPGDWDFRPASSVLLIMQLAASLLKVVAPLRAINGTPSIFVCLLTVPRQIRYVQILALQLRTV